MNSGHEFSMSHIALGEVGPVGQDRDRQRHAHILPVDRRALGLVRARARAHRRRHRWRAARPDDGRAGGGARDPAAAAGRGGGRLGRAGHPGHAGRRLPRPRAAARRSRAARRWSPSTTSTCRPSTCTRSRPTGVAVRPGPEALVHAQDKAVMRARLTALGVPCPRHAVVDRPGRTSRRSGCPACSRRRAAGTTAAGSGWSASSTEARRGLRDRGARPASQVLAEELVDFRRELAALVARSPSGQAAAYPVVASTQLDGICHEVVAPAPDLDARAGRRRPSSVALDHRQGARRRRDPRRRAVRDQRRPDAGQRARDAAAQHRPLEPGRRGHQPVREPPARGPRPAARLAGAARAVDGDGQHPRRPGRPGRAPVRRLPARAGPRPAAAGAPVRQGAAARAARSATSTPTATTSRTASSAPGTPRPGSAATSATRASDDERRDSPLVGIVMGSDSDWPVMKAAATALEEFDVPFEADVVSAHRMPEEMLAYGKDAAGRGLRGDHRRGRGSGAPARDARRGHPAAGDRRTGPAGEPRRPRLAALDRADAGRRAGRDRRDRQRPQRRAARGPDPGRVRRRRCASGWSSSRPSSRTPRRRRARRVRNDAGARGSSASETTGRRPTAGRPRRRALPGAAGHGRRARARRRGPRTAS